jgi:catechol 2,3-dioxygenase-like lactoylglutathione lyase family enzyme
MRAARSTGHVHRVRDVPFSVVLCRARYGCGRIRIGGSVASVKIEVAFTGVPVSDLARGQDFFERILGKPPDVLVNENEVMWQVAEAAWLYVVVDPARAGRALAAVSVPDLDAALGELAGRGIEPSVIEQPGPSARKATVLDLDGNSFALIEVRET